MLALRRPPPRCNITSSSLVPKKTSTAPAPIADDLDRERRVEHHRARRARARRRRAARASTWSSASVPSRRRRRVERRLHVLGIERGGRRADHQAAEREQQPAGDQVGPTKASSSPAPGGLHVRVGELVLALETPASDPRAQDQQHHRQHSARRLPPRRRCAAPPIAPVAAPPAIAAANASSASSGSTIAEHAHVVRDGQRLPGELAPAQRQQVGLEVLGQLLGELRRHRAQREAHQLRRRRRCRTARCCCSRTKKTPVGLDRRAAEQRPKRRGLR